MIENSVISDNSLATRFPELLNEWDFEKNINISPYSILSKSNKRAYWKCSSCGSAWDVKISDRTSKKGSNCPYCSTTHKRVNALNSLASLNPDLTKQWHPIKNGKLTPEQITSRTNYFKKFPVHMVVVPNLWLRMASSSPE